MEAFVTRIREHFQSDDDLFVFQDYFADIPIVYIGFNSLVDMVSTKQNLQNYAQTFLKDNNPDYQTVLGQVMEDSKIADAVSAIVEGKLIIYFGQNRRYVIIDAPPHTLERAISTAINENVLEGTFTAFNEDMYTNIGILRNQIHSANIRVRIYTIGGVETTELSMVYYEGTADNQLVSKIAAQIEMNRSQPIQNLQQLSEKMMGLHTWSLIPSYNQTELPQEAANFLRQGRVILFLDRLPLALVIPNLLWDVFLLDSDRNSPKPVMLFLRGLRVAGVLIALILPALYVALVSVNPEVLRIELALSIAQTREGIPYPALVEIILMLLILELIIESSIRLPKNIGPTITMVGGIILGQAVVQAKLVSNILIIILAATTIANSTIVGLQQSLSLRISKYIIVLLAAIYGVFGIMGGLVLVFAYLSSKETFGIPYTSILKVKDGTKNG